MHSLLGSIPTCGARWMSRVSLTLSHWDSFHQLQCSWSSHMFTAIPPVLGGPSGLELQSTKWILVPLSLWEPNVTSPAKGNYIDFWPLPPNCPCYFFCSPCKTSQFAWFWKLHYPLSRRQWDINVGLGQTCVPLDQLNHKSLCNFLWRVFLSWYKVTEKCVLTMRRESPHWDVCSYTWHCMPHGPLA